MDERDIALLNDYFNGLLPAETARVVEARAAADPAFGQEFALRRELEAFPRKAAQRRALAATLAAVGSDYFQETDLEKPDNQSLRVSGGARWRWLAAAASLVLVSAAVWFFTTTGGPAYRQYAAHNPPSFTVRGAADQAAAAAEEAFAGRDFAAALAALDQLLAVQPGDPSALLYKGICLIELDRFEDARAVLGSMADGNSALRAEAQWYLALSFLKENNKPACKSALLKIAPGELRYAQAQALLKALE